MTWKSNFVFRIIIGIIFVAQYFYGGRYGQGNIFLLLIGIAFAGYGIFGLVQYDAIVKKAKKDQEEMKAKKQTDSKP